MHIVWLLRDKAFNKEEFGNFNAFEAELKQHIPNYYDVKYSVERAFFHENAKLLPLMVDFIYLS